MHAAAGHDSAAEACAAGDPERLFAVATEQVARIFDVPHVRLIRYEPDGSAVVGGFSECDHGPFPIGSRLPLDSAGVIAAVRQTGRAAHVDDYAHVSGEIAAVARRAGMRSAVASPIVVERRLSGAMVVLTPRHEPLPEDTEARLPDFTELIATPIANAESQEARAVLTDEQAALRRVATLVAQGVPSDALFRSVCDEVEALAGAQASAVVRFETDGTATVMGDHAALHPVGARVKLDPDYVVAEVHRTRRAARFDTDDPAAPGMPGAVRAERVRSALASPIVVAGELWGAITTVSRERAFAAGMERRLADFTELVATRSPACTRALSSPPRAGARRGGRRRAPAGRPRSARRRAAAPGAHGDHAPARAAGAGEGTRERAAAGAGGTRARGTDRAMDYEQIAHAIVEEASATDAAETGRRGASQRRRAA